MPKLMWLLVFVNGFAAYRSPRDTFKLNRTETAAYELILGTDGKSVRTDLKSQIISSRKWTVKNESCHSLTED